jgi:hypothetical protein
MIVIDGLHPRYPGNWDHLKLLGSLMNFCLIPQGPQGGYPHTVLVPPFLPLPTTFNITHALLRKISYTKPGLIPLPTYDHAYLFTLKRQ